MHCIAYLGASGPLATDVYVTQLAGDVQLQRSRYGISPCPVAVFSLSSSRYKLPNIYPLHHAKRARKLRNLLSLNSFRMT
jgi:hypothetical protein